MEFASSYPRVRTRPCNPNRARHSRQVRFEQLEPRAMMTADAIMHWNQIALDVVSVDHTLSELKEQVGPGKASRALAIVHVAMYDAINSILDKYESYLVNFGGFKKANIDAAVGQAAHDTLVALYQGQKASIDAALTDWLGDIKNGKSETLGIQLGKLVAKTILKARKNDGANDPSDYVMVGGVGHHQPDPINPTQGLLDPQWGGVDPFGIRSVEAFLPPPPPELTSQEYTDAYNEVMELGAVDSATRTQEQTEIGIFWAYDGTQGLCAPPRLYNQIARVIADQEGNTEYENARYFALINIAMADAGIVGWACKYDDDFWRPVIGIRQGDLDGNPDTVGDPNWTPLGAPASNQTLPNDFTPPFPSYVSGHAIFGAALFRTIERFYGTDNIAFSFTSDEFNGQTTDNQGVVRPEITRSFTKLSDAAFENGQSRIYLGIHWAFDRDEGIACGNEIADNIFERLLEREGRGNSQGHFYPCSPRESRRESHEDFFDRDGKDGFFKRDEPARNMSIRQIVSKFIDHRSNGPASIAHAAKSAGSAQAALVDTFFGQVSKISIRGRA